MAERRNFPYRVAWILFIVVMFVAAGLLLDPDPGRQAWGLGLLLVPLLMFGSVLGLYYWRTRRMAG